MLRPLSEIGLEIKGKREAFGWNQGELARRSGVSRQTISRLETGAAENVKFSVLDGLDTALGGLKLTKRYHDLITMKIGKAAKELGLGINDADLLLFPIHVPGVDTRYELLTPELLAKVAQCLE